MEKFIKFIYTFNKILFLKKKIRYLSGGGNTFGGRVWARIIHPEILLILKYY